MRISCYVVLSQYERDDDERCACPIRMQLTSPVGSGGLSGTVVIDRTGDLPDIYVEDLRTNLPLDDEFCSDFMISVFDGCANSDYLGAGDIHCPLPNLALLMERWYKPLAAQQKTQQIAHALRLVCGGMHDSEDEDALWHLEVRNITDREHPERQMTFLRVHYQPLGLELAAIVAAAGDVPSLTDEIVSNDLLLPTWIVRALMLRLYKRYVKQALPIDGSSVMHFDLEAAVNELLPRREAKTATSLIARAIHFHAQPS